MEQPSGQAPRTAVLLTAATSLLAIAAVAGIYLAVRPAPPAADASTAPAQPAGTGLVDGKDYRVLVAVARVRPTMSTAA